MLFTKFKLNFRFESIMIDRTLTLIDGRQLDPFEAVDDDAGIFGDITFDVDSDNGDHTNFAIVKLNRKQSELRITDQIEERTYTVRK